MHAAPTHHQLVLNTVPAFTTDTDGYLVELDWWNEAVAVALAESLGIQLTADHWSVVHCARDFYARYQLSPVMRPMVNALKADHPHLASSLALMRLFPSPTQSTATTSTRNGSPAKRIACIAGLPRPTNCL